MRKIQRKAVYLCWRQLSRYSAGKSKFKRGMKRLLKNRANNIMRRAFVRGLKVVWHHRVIQTSLRVAAKFACRKRLFAKSFKAFQVVGLANRNGKMQSVKHQDKQKHYYFKMWVKRYMLGDVAAR